MKRIQLYWQQVPNDASLNSDTPFFFWERKGNVLFLDSNANPPQKFIEDFQILQDGDLNLWVATLLFPDTLENSDEVRKLLVYAVQPIYNSHTNLAEKKEYRGNDYIIISFGTEWIPTRIQSHNNNVAFHDFYPPKEFKDLIKVRW